MENDKGIIKTIVDIGNSRIKVLIGELYDSGTRVRVLGYGECESEGIKKSKIENPETLKECVERAINKAKEKIDYPIESVVLGMGTPNVKSRTKTERISFPECTIDESEINVLLEEAEKELLKSNERVLKREVYNIRVNNSGIVRNPLGIVGKELQGDVHLICIDEIEVSHYEEIINRAGYKVEKIYLNSCGSAEAVLDEEEKNKGVALIDIGEGLTDILMFKNGKLIYSKSIPLGGMHYINDLAYILEIPREEAFEILKKFKERENSGKDILTESKKKFTVQYIKNIIDARTGDITKFILDTIEESGFNGYLGKGIVLTGGAVVMDELVGKIIIETGYKVVKKLPPNLKGLQETDSAMSSVIGIFIESIKDEISLTEKKKLEKKEETTPLLNNNSVKTESTFINISDQKDVILDDEVEPTEKKNIFKPILDWFSNYI